MIALLLAGLAFASPSLSDRIQITKVIGPSEVHVSRKLSGKPGEEILHVGEDIFAGDVVTVVPRQVVSLAAFDGSQWKLAPGTRFTAEARKPDKMNLAYWSFEISKGAMWGKVTKDAELKEGFRLKVHTKTAALGIRGTEFLLQGDTQRSGVDVLEGTVWWGTDPNFAPGTYKTISAGSHGELGSDGNISIVESKGDAAKLVKEYGIELSEDSKKVTGTAADCLGRGKGWRNDDGSSVGECVDK